ncbi:MAG TPA: zinc-finger domain-containing protein, partial [Alphaproteobacteria bacterium]|nr:zinc-finger domain-containing protein [Alphaproteobacteria bacterium]
MQDMSENPTEPAETIISESTTVACDGGALGHPRVFLSLLPDGQ